MTRPVAGFLTSTVALGALLAACSSATPPRYHTLMPLPATPAPTVAPTGPLAWEVLPVVIPAQVDQPQWVVRTSDGSLAVLEQERWIAPLGDEIRAAVVERLTELVGAPAAGKRWRVSIDVQRFDTVPGREVRLEATWRLRTDADGAAVLSCRGEFVQPLSASAYPALNAGHRQSVSQLADAIGRALSAVGAGRVASCAT